jgi:capsid assembly protease
MIMLANEASFNEMIERKSTVVQAKLASLRSMQRSEIESPVSGGWLGEWFDKIKSEAESGTFERRGSTAIINICGALDYKYDFWSWLFDSSCYVGIINSVNAAVNDNSIKKIVLCIDSPGGGFHGNVECANAIFAAKDSKEVVAVVDPMAASAGYWLASQASRIVCIESGWVGSLGSQMGLSSYHRYYKDLGIDVELIRAKISPDKNLGAMVDPISDKAREDRQRLVDYAGETFISHVERGRSKSRKQILDNFGQGVMYFAPEAVDRGMVDAIGYLNSEIEESTSNGKQPSQRMAVRSAATLQKDYD